jgi:hypothetical protein
VVVSCQLNYTTEAASVLILLPKVLNFQGATHLLGVGSFSILSSQ